MGTVVELRVVAGMQGRLARRGVEHALDAAEAWFVRVEQDCSRFDPASELRRLCAQPSQVTRVSPLVFRAIQFAVAVAGETEGAFDPTVGARLEQMGFNRHHRTGTSSVSGREGGTWRDIRLDADAGTVQLLHPMTLDLGAVAKGLAIDLAAREMAEQGNFAIDAGGDLYLGGTNGEGDLWSVGIRHPREGASPIDTVRVSNLAVCTSGDYERRTTKGSMHHVVDPRTGDSPSDIVSVTAIGPSAMVADALGTAAFVLGASAGIALFEHPGLEGMVVDRSLTVTTTNGWASLRA